MWGGQTVFELVPMNSLEMFLRNMLEHGGSAVDGAIASLLCTSVVNPQSMGIGGGSIVLVKNKTGEICCLCHTFSISFFICRLELTVLGVFSGGATVYNFRETVPQVFKTKLLDDCPTTFRMSTGRQMFSNRRLISSIIL